jgi:hypothetical protein
MASNAEDAFKKLQSWTILLVGRSRGKTQGTGGLTRYDAFKQSRTGFRDDQAPGVIDREWRVKLVADRYWHRVRNPTIRRSSSASW